MNALAKPVSKAEAYAKITFVMAMWGLSFIASKYAMLLGFGEFTLAFVRYLFVCGIMLPVVRAREGTLKIPEKKDWLKIFLSGLTGISLYFMGEYLGVMRTSVVNASLVLSAIPVVSILWNAMRGQRYRPACWLGVSLSMAGVFFVVYFGAAQEGGGLDLSALAGNLLLFGACVCWVVYIEISNRLLARYSSLSLTAWQGVAGLVGLLPAALLEMPAWKPVPIGGWLAALFLAAVCSALCFFWYAQAIRSLSTLQVAVFVNLTPLVAVVAGVLLLKETASPFQILGGAVIVGSILMVNYGMSSRQSAAKLS